MTEQQQDDLLNKRIIYCSLLLQEYGYRELLSSPLITGRLRYKVGTKLRYIQNQLLQLEKESGISKKLIAKSENLALNNVSLMATIIGTLAIVPECQIDFLEQEFERIVVQAMENFQKNLTNENKI